MDMYDELKQAEQASLEAEKAFARARERIEDCHLKFREALSLGRNVPCKVAILPSGKVVVHAWVESSSSPNQLHVVEADYLTEDGKPRKKFAGERLGGPQ